MIHQILSDASFYTFLLNMVVFLFSSLPFVLHALREQRELHQMRVRLWAYEKELKERGVTLEPRCPVCVCRLPNHMDICPLRDVIAESMPAPIRYLTQPRKPEITVKRASNDK